MATLRCGHFHMNYPTKLDPEKFVIIVTAITLALFYVLRRKFTRIETYVLTGILLFSAVCFSLFVLFRLLQ